jgi:hypothetical protein
MYLKLRKIENTVNIRYYYYPIDTQIPGIVELKENGDVYIIKLSKYDIENDGLYLANKAKAELRKMWESNNFPEEHFLAWG